MWWIILFIPICIYLSVYILAPLNFLTLLLLSITIAIFLWVEIAMIRKDPSKSKEPLVTIGIIAFSLLGGIVLSFLR